MCIRRYTYFYVLNNSDIQSSFICNIIISYYITFVKSKLTNISYLFILLVVVLSNSFSLITICFMCLYDGSSFVALLMSFFRVVSRSVWFISAVFSGFRYTSAHRDVSSPFLVLVDFTITSCTYGIPDI